MMCQACGAPMVEGVRFCARCGARAAFAHAGYAAYPPAVAMPLPRVQQNLQSLGILWCVFGAYRIVGGLLGMFFLHAMTLHSFAGNWPFHRHFGAFGPSAGWMGAFLPLIAVYTVVTAGFALLAGYGLLTRKPWGRILALVAGVLALMKPLLGTALGIYTLWVLAPTASASEYQALTDRT
jgi:hypothetical protein